MAALFFLTGACGLVYQQLWLRQLSLVFGVTVHAVATVLASFFAGLALGSLLAGRWVDRARRPLRWYGAIEVLVGASALATPAALDAVERIYTNLAGALPDSLFFLTLVRFVLSFATLLVPATLMGASLPVVVKSSLTHRSGLGERVSVLYAANTAGAIVGTVVAGFWLIGGFGLMFSFRAAAAVNVLVGTAAILASRAWESTADEPAAQPASPAGREILPEQARRVVLAVFTVSGFVALALEVVWFRVLVLYLDSNTYAFTVMLATVLAGIAAGSALVAPLMRRRVDWLTVVATSELLLSLAALLSLFLLARAYDTVDPESGAGTASLRVMIAAAVGAILPTALLMGAAFPVGVRLWAGGRADESGRRVGIFYSLNVAGGIAGSLAAGFLFIPVFGTRRTLILLAAMLLFSGLALALLVSRPALRLGLAAGAAAAFVLAAVAVVPDPYEAALTRRYPGERVLWIDEGAQTTVSVHERPDGTRVMYLDGLQQASDVPAVVLLHRQIGVLPMAIHPDPRSVLVVGLGGGVTAGAAGAAQNDGTVDVVELSPEVVRGAEYFSAVNGDVLDQSNVRVRVDDGRNFQLVTDERYDVVTADIIQPQHAGAGKVWSVEYWKVARDVLEADGIMLQWIGTDRSTVEYELIMRSFLDVFPDATLWANGTLMVGSRNPLVLDPTALERKLAEPLTRVALSAVGVSSWESLLALYTAGPEEMKAFVGDGPVLTDDRPRIEYYRTLEGDRSPVDVLGLRGDVAHVLPP